MYIQGFSKQNVRPADNMSIEAAQIGPAKHYFAGVCLSRFTNANPNMTKLLLRFLDQTKPEDDHGFKCTTIQCNRNYSLQLHVDKNNHWPSYFIGFGDYKGGRLWCWNKDGTVKWPLSGQTDFKGFLSSIRLRKRERILRIMD